VTNINGEELARWVRPDINQVVEHARILGMPMLGYIDPCGDTLFNVTQMQLVIPELESLEAEGPGAISAAATELLELARQVPMRPHRYLEFLGD
jgi:hypothetical protein